MGAALISLRAQYHKSRGNRLWLLLPRGRFRRYPNPNQFVYALT